MTLTRITDYRRPADLDEAWRLLAESDGTARLLGGGTDLVVRCPDEVSTLVDLARLGLRYVHVDDDGGVRIGAMSTFTDLLEHPVATAYATGVLGEMLAQVGSVLHRNSATVGGHVVRSRLSDVLPVLLALDATVVSYAGAETHRPLAEYLDEDLGPHVVTEVRLPASVAGSIAAFTRFSRSTFDHALVNACCRVDAAGGTVRDVRVVVGESTTVGARVTAAERALDGAALTDEAIAAAAAAAGEAVGARDDWLTSGAYRRHLAGVAVTRCLRAVADRLDGGAR